MRAHGDPIPGEDQGLSTVGAPCGQLEVRLAGRKVMTMDDLQTRRPRREADGPISGASFEPFFLPVRYPHNEAFVGIFGIDLDAALARLPSDDLHPVRLRRDRAALAIGAFLYRNPVTEVESGAIRAGMTYGEIGITLMCTTRPTPPLLPLAELPIGESRKFGLFILHLPVTTFEAYEAGRIIWNAPKFVADMDFTIGPDELAVELSEGGTSILRLETRRGGWTRPDREDLVWYASKDQNLLRTDAPVDGIQQLRVGGRSGQLELGAHPIADELRELDADTTPTAVRTYLRHSLILPAPEIVGASKPYDGWLRHNEPQQGRLTVTYPELPPIDVYSISAEGGYLTEPTRTPSTG